MLPNNIYVHFAVTCKRLFAEKRNMNEHFEKGKRNKFCVYFHVHTVKYLEFRIYDLFMRCYAFRRCRQRRKEI